MSKAARLLAIGAVSFLAYCSQGTADEFVETDPLIQAEIDRISPEKFERFVRSSQTVLTLRQGTIGAVNIAGMMAREPSSLIAVLEDHRQLTGAYEGLDLRIVRMSPTGEGHRIHFQQVVDGIIVDSASRVYIDRDGVVQRLYTVISDPAVMTIRPTILESEAIQLALNALSNEVGFTVTDTGFDLLERSNQSGASVRPKLYFRFEEEGQPPRPIWRMLMYAKGKGTYWVRVDAATGATHVSSTMQVM